MQSKQKLGNKTEWQHTLVSGYQLVVTYHQSNLEGLRVTKVQTHKEKKLNRPVIITTALHTRSRRGHSLHPSLVANIKPSFFVILFLQSISPTDPWRNPLNVVQI